jgi:hypothetical protein
MGTIRTKEYGEILIQELQLHESDKEEMHRKCYICNCDFKEKMMFVDLLAGIGSCKMRICTDCGVKITDFICKLKEESK